MTAFSINLNSMKPTLKKIIKIKSASLIQSHNNNDDVLSFIVSINVITSTTSLTRNLMQHESHDIESLTHLECSLTRFAQNVIFLTKTFLNLTEKEIILIYCHSDVTSLTFTRFCLCF